jgi:nucleotidyltransferase substrate binding protein (TIGR01987 family)
MTVDITPLINAVARLAEALEDYRAEPSRTIIRDGLIQRFEFTYDLAPKMLRRVLASRSEASREIDQMSFPALMRTAFEQGFVDETWPEWLEFRKKRNISSHTYDEVQAREVAEVIPAFLETARRLIDALDRKLGE